MREYYEDYWSDPNGGAPLSDPTTPWRIQALRSVLPQGQPAVLDVGCGDGCILRALSPRVGRAVGVDISEAALEVARSSSGADIEFVQGDAEEGLPFDSDSFDVVFSGDVIEHLFDSASFLREMHRVLKPNGVLALTTPYHGLIKSLVICSFYFDKHFDPRSAHVRFFTVRSLRDLLSKCGFEQTCAKLFGRHWPLNRGMFVVARRVGCSACATHEHVTG